MKNNEALSKEKKSIKIWAHRGCSGRYPENTLQAFRAAAKIEGLYGIELDIQLSKDGELVVIHDENLDRTTNGSGPVRNLTLKELKKLKIKAKSVGLFKKYECIPTMREVLDLLKPACLQKGLYINIELKNSRVRYEGMEEKILSLVKDYGLEEKVLYSSFNGESISLIKKLNPSAKTGILAASAKVCLEFSRSNNVDALHPCLLNLDEDCLFFKSSLPVRTWGTPESFFPNKEEFEINDLKKLGDMGVTDIFTNVPEEYFKFPRRQTPILDFNMAFNYETGVMESRNEPVMADFHFYRVSPGDKIVCLDKDWLYQVAFYCNDIDENLIHTYCYSPEESWATFTKNIGKNSWKNSKTLVKKHGWVRIAVKKANGANIEPSEKRAAQSSLLIIRQELSHKEKPFFADEIEDTVKKVRAVRNSNSLVFALLADSHYVINGGWEDTVSNLYKVNEALGFDGLIHLGDFSDGMTSSAITKEYFYSNLNDLRFLGCPLYFVLGNHDANYFRGNTEPFSENEQRELFLAGKNSCYYVDFEGRKFRMIVLFSFDHTQVGQNNRYGFPDEEVDWMKAVLDNTPKDWKVLVLSHVPILAEMHFWSDEIKNGPQMLKVMEDFQRSGGKILAFVHGHIHSDWIEKKSQSFPIVSIGCAKVEDDQIKKSPGSTTYPRKMGDVTQELWDILVVDTKTGRLDFVRFGAGEDRRLE
ncbi:MAG: metallophosphoesterase [Treponema sp.]|nr:metallophosphoesterase [Treponema sp.]